MQIPRDPADNEVWSPRWGRQLLRYVRSITPQSSNTCRIRRTPGGTTFYTKAKTTIKRSGSATALSYPFDVSTANTSGNDWDVDVTPGTVNQVLPSNVFTTLTLTAAPPWTRYLVATVSTSSGKVTGAVLSLETTAPEAPPVLEGSPPTSFAVLIGIIVTGIFYRTIDYGSVTVASKEAFRVDKVSPTYGLSPYNIYYTWQVVEGV